MTMKYLKEKSEKSSENKKPNPPDWASDKSSGFRKAWNYVEEKKKEKASYIKNHSKVTDFSTQKHYQFSGAKISKELDIDRTSILYTSKDSPKFKEYLDKVNADLMRAKDKKLKKISKKSSRGSVREKKDDLVLANKILKKRVDELEAQKTEELVRRTFDELPLPVKKTLGIA